MSKLLLMLKSVHTLIVALLILITTACGNRDYYRIAVDVVEPISIARFDSLIYKYVHLSDSAAITALMTESGEFWKIYNRHILGLNDAPLYCDGLRNFYRECADIGLYDMTFAQYESADSDARLLSQVAARYKRLFPDKSTPVFQYHVSGLSAQSVVTMDSLISVSIDCYLDNCSLYNRRYYDYELQQHSRSRLLPDVSEVLLRNALPSPPMVTLLDAMVYEGRIAYLTGGLIEDNTSMAIMGYSVDENNWCVENEELVWTTIIEQGDLFKSDNITINKYLRPAPFTATLAQNSPGRVGRWVGWRIVDEYARREGLTPMQIATDRRQADEVLRLSGYDGR